MLTPPHLGKLLLGLVLVAWAIGTPPPSWIGTVQAAGSGAKAASTDMRQRLAQPVDILWRNAPLGAALRNLASAQHVAILLDRRVDPSQTLNLTMQAQPLESACKTIADQCGLGVTQLDDVIYFGPPKVVEQLQPTAQAFAAEVRQLRKAAQRKFFERKPLRWEDFTTPRDLLAQLERQSGVEITGLDQVPHDLWAAAELPPLTLVDRLSLIAIQFDLTFEMAAGGKQLELTPISAQ